MMLTGRSSDSQRFALHRRPFYDAANNTCRSRTGRKEGEVVVQWCECRTPAEFLGRSLNLGGAFMSSGTTHGS